MYLCLWSFMLPIKVNDEGHELPWEVFLDPLSFTNVPQMVCHVAEVHFLEVPLYRAT